MATQYRPIIWAIFETIATTAGNVANYILTAWIIFNLGLGNHLGLCCLWVVKRCYNYAMFIVTAGSLQHFNKQGIIGVFATWVYLSLSTSTGQILLEQMSLWQLASVKDGPRNLPLKFGQIGPVTAEILLTLSLVWWWWWVVGGGGGGGVKSFSCKTQT